jgi:hypothetical protein
MEFYKKLSESEAAELSAELSALSKQQSDALLESAYPELSMSESEAYERRRMRIEQLCELLANAKIGRDEVQFLRRPRFQGRADYFAQGQSQRMTRSLDE